MKRSWGWYWVLLDRKHFKVKILKFKKGHGCSLQYHRYRNELWLFLRGRGMFYRPFDNGAYGYSEVDAGDYIQVSVDNMHRYIATTTTWVLEIHYGKKCEEDDIVRV